MTSTDRLVATEQEPPKGRARRDAICDVVFFHIPKTAGTSVSNFFLSRFPRDNCFVQSEPLSDLRRNSVNQPIYYGAHLEWSLFDLFPFKNVVFTFLREPAARLVSVYNFTRQSVRDRDHANLSPAAAATLRYGLDDWLQFVADGGGETPGSPFQNGNDNTYLRCLLGRRVIAGQRRLSYAVNGPEMMLARERLRKFCAVGLVEEFQRSMHLICEAVRVRPPLAGEVETRNVTKSSEPIVRTNKTEKLLHDLTTFDRAIYAYGRELFCEQALAYKVAP